MFLETLARDPVYFITAVVLVIISITIHEFSHALAATWQGDDTPAKAGRLTLNPIVHMGWTSLLLLALAGVAWGATPVNPSRFRHRYGEAFVSFAGPLSNLIMMMLCIIGAALLTQQQIGSPTPTGEEAFVLFVLFLGAYLNAFLFLLNMLPIPPLDGYAIFETFVPVVRPYATAFSQYGFLILIVLFFLFGLGAWLSGIASELVQMTLSMAKNLL